MNFKKSIHLHLCLVGACAAEVFWGLAEDVYAPAAVDSFQV